jgi:HEAT repeat protein
MTVRVPFSACLSFLLFIGIAAAQDDAAARAARLAEGWASLGKGDVAAASRIAWQELGRDPANVGALSLAVEADLAKGATAALATYEKWLGSRRVDSPYILRRLSRVTLVEARGKQPNAAARLEALRALAADGDAAAAAELEQALASNRLAETRVLASLGSERAVKQLIAQLASMPGSKTPLIDALGQSKSKLAIPPLTPLLSDPNDLNRATAAEALSRLGATEAIPQIQAMLNDPVFTVKLKAAGALVRLNDASGLPFLNELMSSEHAGIRLAAAQELESRPDAAWQGLVRSLTSDPDPLVRVQAARLIAPYDLPLANTVLDGLMRDSNPAIREAASGVLVERVASDFASLRALLHSGDLMVRVKAAARVLELTR